VSQKCQNFVILFLHTSGPGRNRKLTVRQHRAGVFHTCESLSNSLVRSGSETDLQGLSRSMISTLPVGFSFRRRFPFT
jgi:hypothetical protein